ncbi:hypothetical protein DMB44_08100 [Thermoplasma sp. Kam2015]|uniref:DUF167 domain-containing protein n=1 Tax=Thermoplasma sp. Kam2015 TaxID=2094122 RepID=UPI000D8BBF73|nr:DUF167 domain-containing protein [Thermoplasma sp. Kam2015]PYB67628.1 hypothetical protein DMB44_08100 [Thermoplasma sp. Kam2015]
MDLLNRDRLIVMVKVRHGRGDIRKDGDYIVVSTEEPRENGRANADVIRQLSRYFNADPSKIRIQRGKTSTNKTILIED